MPVRHGPGQARGRRSAAAARLRAEGRDRDRDELELDLSPRLSVAMTRRRRARRRGPRRPAAGVTALRCPVRPGSASPCQCRRRRRRGRRPAERGDSDSDLRRRGHRPPPGPRRAAGQPGGVAAATHGRRLPRPNVTETAVTGRFQLSGAGLQVPSQASGPGDRDQDQCGARRLGSARPGSESAGAGPGNLPWQ